MKKFIALIFILSSLSAWGESNCDVRIGYSQGIKVMEFSTGNVIHSKMSINDVTPDALFEELISLQEMGICNEKIFSKKCSLKLAKEKSKSKIYFFRNLEKWKEWNLSDKKDAQIFIKSLMRIGFCL